MQFDVECFENTDAFGRHGHPFFRGVEDFEATKHAMRRVMVLTVMTDNAEGAAQEAWEIANAPWEPTDIDGRKWDHSRVRSMSSGDVVVVHTPDGPVAYGCLFIGWQLLPPTLLPAGVAF